MPGINGSSLGSDSIHTNTESVVEVIYAPAPSPGVILDPPQTPQKLLVYYNGATDTARLYIVSRSGLRLLPL